MKCIHCGQEIQFAEVCPHCGQKLHYGGNTVLYASTRSGKLTYKQIFANVFKKHTPEDTKRSLMSHPAAGIDMLSTWEKPWLFARLFVMLLVMSVILYMQSNAYMNSDSLSLTFLIEFSFVTTLIGPLTISLLIWEMDIHRQVNLVNFLALVFFGGILTIAAALPLNSALNWPAWTAGLTEETVKLLVAVLFILFFRRKGLHCLDGLAIGAAVGAGFAFWENIFYAFVNSGETGIVAMSMWRSFWELFSSHMLYTAPYIGALCFAINGGKLEGKHFKSPFFLIMLAYGMGAHALNNAEDNFGYAILLRINDSLVFPVYWIQVALAILSWGVLLYMLRRGINQALETNDINLAVEEARSHTQAAVVLMCQEGTHAGSAFAVEAKPMLIGRQSSECNLVLGGDNVSRRHGMLRLEKGRAVYRDLGSSNGSYVNGEKIAPNTDTVLNPGDTLELGSGAERFVVT